jgi:AFG3 family protein
MRVCSERTRTIVHEKRELIHRLAEKLLELETIDQNIIAAILGERPFKMSKQHEEYIKEKKRISEEVAVLT